ncbi:response regulator transcription factor [Dyadobacter sp. LHD-138]|uniref:response regulator transcription factor n=1 Tax=Dyadobacter sp. LHD-138 TaxID=3071413 RepID=UPI0027DF0A37|nr:response regulator transcription factor [Dyadobacter sp. LHD-138]MDQ6478913.1 response regulator transcription factor [Dyadobacter sp. LHD-138]
MKKRITIIEDNASIREGFSAVLDTIEKYKVMNLYSNCEDALTNLDQDQPDVVLMDIELPGMDGIAGTIRIKKQLPNCIVLIITVLEDSEKVFRSLCAGAGGYIVKNSNLSEIVQNIDEALAGGAPMSLSIARMVVQSFRQQQDSPLTDREIQVLQSIAEGKSYSKIALDLYVSKETIRSHIKNIYRKLEVSSKADAIKIANSNKWVTGRSL